MVQGIKKQPRQKRSREMVRAILDAAAKVLVEEGWAAASTNRVAEVAGVSVGSLYQYFPNKESLVIALAHHHGEAQLAQLVVDLIELQHLPIAQAIPRYVEANIKVHLEAPELHVHLTSQVLAHGLQSIQELQGKARVLVRGYLEAHRHELVVQDLDIAAWLLVSTVEAAIHGAILDDTVRLEDPAFAREVSAMVCRYLGVS